MRFDSCPVCGAGRPDVLLLRRDSVELRACSACGTACFDPPPGPLPAGASTLDAATLGFYLQQGAGLWSITAPLGALGRPAGTRLLEVGCGFGLGLHFARAALGWVVKGVDPSAFAAAGGAALHLPIAQRGLTAEDCDGTADVVLASEVIEHVTDPRGFAAMLKAALAPDGLLVLTTPDVAAARPDTPPGLLTPLLSIGHHAVLFSASSLERLLREAGFAVVEVTRRGTQLLARASNGDLPPALETATRTPYRAWLRVLADEAETGGDLWFGAIGRAYREAVAAGDLAAARKLWAAIEAACARRYGAGPEALGASPTPLADLAALGRRQPLSLGPLLLHRAIEAMLSGRSRRDALPLLERARGATAELRRALHQAGADDGDAEDIEWTAGAEMLLCAAKLGEPGLPERLAAFGPAPVEPERRRASLLQRCFAELVHAGRLDEALAVRPMLPPPSDADATATGDALSALHAIAMLELGRPGGDPQQALASLARLAELCRSAAPPAADAARRLRRPALQAEALALRRLGRPLEAAWAATRAAVSV